MTVLGKWPLKPSFSLTLGKPVTATPNISISVHPIHPEGREVYIVQVEENETQSTLLPSKMVFHNACK